MKQLEDIQKQKKKLEATESLNMFKLAAQQMDYLYICIDALDELAEQTRRQLLKVLGKELNMATTRIFITARSQIQMEITQYLKIDIRHIIDITASQDDIREFISSKIKEDSEFDPDGMTPKLENEILTTILNLSQGM